MREPDLGDEDRLASLEHRLGRIERLLTIGFAAQITARREAAGVDDQVVAAILECSSEWVGAGHLKAAVRKRSGDSPRTIVRRLNQLLETGALERRGQTSSIQYRSTGLLG